jgi:ribosomal protein S18 acetylase RimI-like enzyme
MKTVHIYKRFAIADGRKVTLRRLESKDLDAILQFINALVNEKQRDRETRLYVGFDQKITREEETKWLAETITAIKRREIINVIAEIDGRIIANGEVTRGRYRETRHYGHLGLTTIGEYRGRGIGRKVIEMLIGESRKVGLKTLDVEFLAENKSARLAYEKSGFKQVGLIPKKVLRNGKYFNGLIMARTI